MGIAERMGGYLMEIPVKAAVKIEAGELVAVGADGYAVTATKAPGLKIAGCSATLADNRTGANGDVKVLVKRGIFVLENDGKIKNTDILKDAYVVDSNTVTNTAEGSSKAGKIIGVEADGVVIEIM